MGHVEDTVSNKVFANITELLAVFGAYDHASNAGNIVFELGKEDIADLLECMNATTEPNESLKTFRNAINNIVKCHDELSSIELAKLVKAELEKVYDVSKASNISNFGYRT